MNFSSNINEIIRTVLNSFFFFTKWFCTHQKHLKALKNTKTKPSKGTKCILANNNKICASKTSKGKKVTYSLICVFVFSVREEKKIENKKIKRLYKVMY